MSLNEKYLEIKRKLFDKAYGDLNDMQRKAVFTVNGPLLILAGAGSGKTTVLVRRIAYVIKFGNAYASDRVPQNLDELRIKNLEEALKLSPAEIEANILPEFACNACPPYRMLAITFTNKAANEIKNRLANAFSDMEEGFSDDIWAGTFHSICMRILRRYADRLGYRNGFSIYDTEDAKRAILSAMKKCRLDEKQFPVKSVQNAISRAKDKLQTADDLENEAGADYRLTKVALVYREYEKQLLDSNAMDFDDIIMNTVTLFRENSDVRELWQSRFLYVCVDEYQDTNRAQFELTRLLGGGFGNVMVVGDDDQSIYRFRGATVENILGFDKVYKTAQIIRLEQNYRSTQNILNAANAVISNNNGRKGKTLWTSGGEGDKISVYLAENQDEEARYIADTIQREVASGRRKFRDFAVLFRMNAQSRSLENAFIRSAVPHRLLGGTRFTDRKEIKDVAAYLHLINNNSDRERLLRIINEPKRKIGDTTVNAVIEIAEIERKPLFYVIGNADKYVALSRVADKLKAFALLIHRLTEAARSMTLPDLFDYVLDETGYRKMLEADSEEEGNDRLDYVAEFKSAVIEYTQNNENPTLSGFLEESALAADVDKYDENADAAVLMTIHSAKGLEFPVVFLPGMEDGIFPGMQTIVGDTADMEEERRLAYVALTRAKDKIYVIHCRQRLIYAQTAMNPLSRFVKEIPDELTIGGNPHSQPVRSYLSGFGSKPAQKAPQEKFEPGDTVKHPTYGRGEILSARNMGSDVLYEVVFDSVGTKKIMGSYSKLKKS